MKPTVTYIYKDNKREVCGRRYVKPSDEISFTTEPMVPEKPGKIQEIIDSGKSPTVAPSQYIQ